MLQRGLLFAALGIACASAWASYDFVLVADAGTNLIHRFDGSSGAYLGAFGQGLQSITSMGFNKSTGRVLVSDFSGIHEFDAYTGTYYGGIQVPSRTSITPWDATYWLFSDASTVNYIGYGVSPITGWYASSMAGTGVYSAFAKSGASQLYVFNDTAGLIERYSGSPGAFTRVGTQLLTPGANRGLKFRGSDVIWTNQTFTRIYYGFDYGAGLSATYTNVNTSLIGSIKDADYGHGNTYYVVGRNAANTSGVLVRGSFGFNGLGGVAFGSGVLQQPIAVAVIAAPEPGTLAVLALGALAILRRKRK